MNIGTILKAIHKHAAIHECLAVFFAFCWFTHFAASLKMEMRSHFASMDDETLRDMALIDWVAAHSWVAIAYVLLVVASVAFLQIRGRPEWIYWLAAAVFCIPCVVYLDRCVYISGKLLGG